MKTAAKWLVGTLLAVLMVAGVLVLATWESDRPVSALQARWAPPPSTFLEIDGMQVHVRDEGPAEDALPLVLLHGTSSSLHTWDGWASALTPTRRVIRFDLPGFGLTGPTPDRVYSLERYANTLMQVLDRLQVSRCIVVGNSLGGYVAWYTVTRHPDRFEKMVLIDASGYQYQSASAPIGFRLASIPALAALTTHLLPRNMIATSVRSVYGDPSKVTEEQIDRYYDLTLRQGNRQALVDRFQQIQSGMHQEKIATLRLPTLILWGGKDQLVPPANAERFHQDIAGSQLNVFPELGHIPQEEDPLRTLAAAKHFLAPP